MSKLSFFASKPSIIKVTTVTLIAIVGLLVFHQQHAFAINWNALPSVDVRKSVITNDSYGTSSWKGGWSASSSYCQKINAPLITLLGYPWIYSPAGSQYDASAYSTTIAYNTAPTNMQFYYTWMTFSCHQVTQTNKILYGSYADLPFPPGQTGNAPADDSLIAMSQQQLSNYVESVTYSSTDKTGNGTVDTANGSTSGLIHGWLNEPYQGGTRYWFPTASSNPSCASGVICFKFNSTSVFTGPTGTGGNVTVTLHARERPVNTNVTSGTTAYVCVYNGNGGNGVTGYKTDGTTYNFSGSIPGGVLIGGQYRASSGNARDALVLSTSGGTTPYYCPDTTVNYPIDFFVKSRAPSVNITANPLTCSSTTLTGTASDPDDPSAELSVKLSVDGSYVSTTTTSSHNFSFNISSYINSGSAHTFTVTALGVDSSGNQDGVNASASVSSGVCLPCPGAGSSNLAAMPITLTAQHNTGNLAGLYSSTPNSTVTTYTPNNKYEITSIVPSVGKTNNPNPNAPDTATVSWSPTGWQNSANFTGNYKNMSQAYPYDSEVVTVNYDASYTQTVYTSSSTPTVINGTTYYAFSQTSQNTNYVFAETETSPDQPTLSNAATPSGNVDNMPECFNRTFTITPGTSGSSVTLQPSDTTSTNIVYTSAPMKADYNVAVNKGGSMLRPSLVNNIDFKLVMTINHLFGGSTVSSTTFSGNGTAVSNSGTNLNWLLASGNPKATVTTTLSGTANPNFNGDFTGSQYGTSETDANLQLSITYPATLKYGDQVCITSFAVNPTGGQVNDLGVQQAITAGAVQVDNGSPATCSARLAAKPYLKVYGGDAWAGTGAGTTASCLNATADAQSWNIATSPSYNGAGSLLAALVGGLDNQFASAQVSGTGAPPPTGLTFANTTGGFGGNFIPSKSDCAPDYYGVGSTLPSSPYPGGSISSLASANYSIDTTGSPSGVSIPGGTLSGNQHVSIYVKGANPVIITGNIDYAGITPTKIPSFRLITNGTPIGISPTVTNLSGLYVAEGGTIDDCYGVGSGDLFYDTYGDPGAAAHANTCGYKLTVAGSFIASLVNLKRTAYNGGGSPSTFDNANGDSISPGGNQAAEEFDFSPLNWLAPQSQNGGPPVQSVTSVPPVL